MFKIIFLLSCFFSALWSVDIAILRYDKRLYQPYYVKTLEPVFKVVVWNVDLVQGNIGGHYPAFSLDLPSLCNRANSSFAIQAGFNGLILSSLLNKGNMAFDLESIDAMFGGYADFRFWIFSASVSYAHRCAHLSEGVYNRLDTYANSLTAKRYSREYLEFDLDVHLRDVRFYAEWQKSAKLYHAYKDTRNLMTWRLGAEYWFTGLKYLHPYLGAELSASTETEYRITQAAEIGISIVNKSQFKIFADFFNGVDPRGNFHTSVVRKLGFGIAYTY